MRQPRCQRSSQRSVGATDGDRHGRRRSVRQRSLLADTTVRNHVVVRERIAVAVDVGRMDHPGIMLDISRQPDDFSCRVG